MRTSVNLLCFLCKICQRTHYSFLFSHRGVGTEGMVMTAKVAVAGSMKSHHCSL